MDTIYQSYNVLSFLTTPTRRVVEGTRVLDKLEMVDTYNDRPTKQCVITDCGVLMEDKD